MERRFRPGLFSQRSGSLFREVLSCLHLSTRSSSSSITTKHSHTGRTSSFSQYQSIGGLVNTDNNFSQVNFCLMENRRILSLLLLFSLVRFVLISGLFIRLNRDEVCRLKKLFLISICCLLFNGERTRKSFPSKRI